MDDACERTAHRGTLAGMTTFDDSHAQADATFGPCNDPDCPTGQAGGHPDDVKIHAASRPANDTTAEPHRWAVEADDYDTGLTEIRDALPEGFVLLSLQVDRD